MRNQIKCPSCGGSNLHHYEVKVFERHEDATEGLCVVIAGSDCTREGPTEPAPRFEVGCKMNGNPSDRRQGLIISLWCEGCSKNTEMHVYQDRGVTFVDVSAEPRGNSIETISNYSYMEFQSLIRESNAEVGLALRSVVASFGVDVESETAEFEIDGKRYGVWIHRLDDPGDIDADGWVVVKRWGRWSLSHDPDDESHQALTFDPLHYWIPLDRIHEDWERHLVHKSWMTSSGSVEHRHYHPNNLDDFRTAIQFARCLARKQVSKRVKQPRKQLTEAPF